MLPSSPPRAASAPAAFLLSSAGGGIPLLGFFAVDSDEVLLQVALLFSLVSAVRLLTVKPPNPDVVHAALVQLQMTLLLRSIIAHLGRIVSIPAGSGEQSPSEERNYELVYNVHSLMRGVRATHPHRFAPRRASSSQRFVRTSHRTGTTQRL